MLYCLIPQKGWPWRNDSWSLRLFSRFWTMPFNFLNDLNDFERRFWTMLSKLFEWFFELFFERCLLNCFFLRLSCHSLYKLCKYLDFLDLLKWVSVSFTLVLPVGFICLVMCSSLYVNWKALWISKSDGREQALV